MHSKALFLIFLCLAIGNSVALERNARRKNLKSRIKRSYVSGSGYAGENYGNYYQFKSDTRPTSAAHMPSSTVQYLARAGSSNDIDDPHAHLGGASPVSSAADFSRNNDFHHAYMPKGVPTTPPFYQATHHQRPTASARNDFSGNSVFDRAPAPDIRQHHNSRYPTETHSAHAPHFENYPSFAQRSSPFFIPQNEILLEPLPYVYVTNGHIHSPGCGHHDYAGATVPFFVH